MSSEYFGQKLIYEEGQDVLEFDDEMMHEIMKSNSKNVFSGASEVT